MTRKQRLIRMIRSTSNKKYWGILTRGPAFKTFRKPYNFTSLLYTQVHNAITLGKEKPNQPSENIIS